MSERGSKNDSVATVIENFIAELQRRKVVRVAIVYAAFAWLVIQFSDIIIEAFSAPDWVMRVLLLFLILALPATLILAWLFDITPTGIHLTSDAPLGGSEMHASIMLISDSSPNTVAEGEILCSHLSSKLNRLIKSYEGRLVGMHNGHCVVQFEGSGRCVSCGLAVIKLLSNSMKPASISISAGHYVPAGKIGAEAAGTQAINIAENISPPTRGLQQLLTISATVYEDEFNRPGNPLLEYCNVETYTSSGHDLLAYSINPDALHNPGVRWRLREDRTEISAQKSLMSRHRLLLVSVLMLVIVFSWLYLKQTNNGFATQPSLAIMPFRSLDESTESKAISLGLNEDLQDRVRRLEGIQLTSNRSSRALSLKALDVPELGRRLAVNYLLEGSTRLLGEQFRITIDLSETRTGKVIWSDRYQTGQDELYSVLETIIQQVAIQLNIKTGNGTEQIQISNQDYGLYLKAIGSFKLANALTHLDKTEKIFQNLLLRYPEYAPAEAGLCRVYFTRFNSSKAIVDYHKAANYCESARQTIDDNVNILQSLAKMNNIQENWATAEAYIAKALTLEPKNVELLLVSASISKNKGDHELAEEVLLEAIRAEPGYWRSYDRLGMLYFSTGKFSESITELNKASALMPTEVEIYNRLGAVYFQLGNFAKAADAFLQSIELKPNYAGYTNAGTLYYFFGDYIKAREFNLKATTYQPKNYLLWRNLADSESAIPGLYSSAIKHYQRVTTMAEELLQVTPNDTQAMSNLAIAYAQTDQPELAEKQIQLALSIAPDDANVLYDASIIYTRHGNEVLAKELLQRTIKAGMPAEIISATPGLNALYTTSDQQERRE